MGILSRLGAFSAYVTRTRITAVTTAPPSPTVHRSPQECGKLLVKRLIALPGDKVASLKPILVSSAPSDTNQVKTLPPYPDTEVIVPEGHGWLEGDAPFNSEDSNHFGPVGVVFLSRVGT